MTSNANFDLLIRGGTVIDGTKAPRFDADVGITGGRIMAIGNLQAHTATRVIDASDGPRFRSGDGLDEPLTGGAGG